MAHAVEGSLIQRESQDLILYGPDNKPVTYMLRNIKKTQAFAAAMNSRPPSNPQKSDITSGLDPQKGFSTPALQSPAGEWRDINTAPKDGSHILVYRPKRPRKSGPTISTDYWMMDCKLYPEGTWGCSPLAYMPTHWMPLPPAPTGEG